VKAVLPLALVAALGGCANEPERQRPRPDGISALAPVDDGIPLGALPRQTLPPGQCGVFLWKAGPGARLVLTAKAEPAIARILLSGVQTDLPRTAGGDIGAGQTRTTYSDGSTSVVLDLSVEQRPGLTQGAAIPSGSLRLDIAGGSSFVVPVTGLLACVPAAAR